MVDRNKRYGEERKKIIGLNVSRARADIANFESQALGAGNSIEVSFHNFYDTLCTKWGSPNAVEYTSKLFPYTKSVLDDYWKTVHDTTEAAVQAAMRLASSHGGSFSYSVAPQKSSQLPTDGCGDMVDGIVGMQVEPVKVSLETFISYIANALSKLDSITDSIAFYDEEGSLLQTYSDRIQALKSTFADLVNAVKEDIDHYMESEINIINRGKESAQSELQSFSMHKID